MAKLFSIDEMHMLGAMPTVPRAWFLKADLPSGMAYFHNGYGNVELDGQTWIGGTNPSSGQVASIGAVEEPRFGTAPSVEITISAANVAFFKSMHDSAREIEGRPATLYWLAYNMETLEPIGSKKACFVGYMSAPVLTWSGIGTRGVSITLESVWSAKNYPFGGRFTDADQRRRYPGDRAFEFAGVEISESWN